MIKIKNCSLVRFVIALFLFGLTIGIVVYFSFKPNLTEYINNFKNLIVSSPNNTFLLNVIIISSIFLLSLLIVGTPLIVFFIFYEGLSIGYTLSVFISFFGFKGALFYLLFFIVVNLIFVVLSIFFSIQSLNFSYKLVKNIIAKNIDKVYKMLIEHVLRYGIIVSICIINSLLTYLLSNKLISLFIGLIS